MKVFNVLSERCIGFFCLIIILGCSNPQNNVSGKDSEADIVARKIEAAINKEKWDQTEWIQWTFAGSRNYLWDRQRNYLETDWDKYRVQMDLETKNGVAYRNDTLLTDEDLRTALDQAWGNFCNDEFWLNAPAKLFQPGTDRSLVTKGDSVQLKVEYTSGGVTPGDFYIWNFNKNHRPTSFEMYVSVIPEPGVIATWEGWQELESGAMIAPRHEIGTNDLILTNIKSGNNFTDFERVEDPFLELIK